LYFLAFCLPGVKSFQINHTIAVSFNKRIDSRFLGNDRQQRLTAISIRQLERGRFRNFRGIFANQAAGRELIFRQGAVRLVEK